MKIREFLHSSRGVLFKYMSEVQNALYTYLEAGSRHVKFHETMEEWDDVVRLFEDDVFVNYRWNSDSDDILIPLYDPMFELLKERSERSLVRTAPNVQGKGFIH